MLPTSISGPPEFGFTFDELRLFERIAELGSLAAAARDLELTPSQVTRRIAALERTLKVRLFERSTRKVKLTDAGQVALTWARQAMASYQDVADDLASLQARPAGTIRLALNNYAAIAYMPSLIERFCTLYPEIRITVTTTDAVVDLVETDYDLALHTGRIPDSRLVAIRLRQTHRVLCASPDYLQHHGLPRKLEDLGRHDCIVHSTNEVAQHAGNAPLNWYFLRGKRVIAQEVKPRVAADSHMVCRELVRKGVGIGRLGLAVVAEDLARGSLVELLPGWRCVYPDGELPGIWLIYPHRRVLYRTRVLIDFLTRELGESADGKSALTGNVH
jgi:DNA-binding transcriptional LysR family regulator